MVTNSCATRHVVGAQRRIAAPQRCIVVVCHAGLAAVSWAVSRYRTGSSPSDHNTLRCIAIQCPSATSLLQYTPYHNTVIVLQYNSNSLIFYLLQYNAIKLHTQAAIQFSYCNTIPSQLHPSLVIQLQYNFFSSPRSCNTISASLTIQSGQ